MEFQVIRPSLRTHRFQRHQIIATGVAASLAFAMLATNASAMGGKKEEVATEPSQTEIAKQVLAAADSIKTGETTFYQNCAYCHGSKGSGGKARPLQCRDMLPDYLFTTISNGRRRGSLIMPPWKDSMDEQTRWQLVAYILSLKDLPECPK